MDAVALPPMHLGLSRRWLAPRVGATKGDLVERLLAARGIEPSHRDAFLRGSLADVEPAWSRPDLVAAADAVLDALERGRRIAIYGDYDVDGVTATAILWRTLKAIRPDAHVRTYVPHRMEEGYGLNTEALAALRTEGIDLVVSVDCGITAVDEADRARALGLGLVITDHHQPREDGRLPTALAIAHPNLPGHSHRFPHLCGAAVAWKLAWAMLDRLAGSPEGHRLPEAFRTLLTDLLPLAAIGTIADVMPLVGENRSLVRAGIACLRQTPLIGLRALLAHGDIAKDGVDSEKIAFRLAPRLNACGRLGSAAAAVRLFTEAEPDEAVAIVRELDATNDVRRRTEQGIHEAAARRVRELGLDREDRRAIVLASPDWHAGVVGIVCSRLVEEFARPTILCQELDGICKGSGRSIHGFDLLGAIRGCGEAPLKSGGHEHAAGISVERDRFASFADAFERFANDRITAEELVPTLPVDTIAALRELSVPMVKACEGMAPFGRGNPRPAVRIDDVTLTSAPRTMGQQGAHLLLTLRQDSAEGRASFVKAKWWRGRAFADKLVAGARLDLVVEPKVDRYLGTEAVEVDVRDVRVR
jgi:single-stranded-DNA-specific exonuclease